jgi:hypothetical protein
LNDEEVIIVANTSLGGGPVPLQVIVDATINAAGPSCQILLSNLGTRGIAGKVSSLSKGTVTIVEVDGSTSDGPLQVLPVTLQPGEAQILAV